MFGGVSFIARTYCCDAPGDFPYTYLGKSYSGFYALPADGAHGGAADVVPGMLIGHQWMGLGEMEKYRAEQAAGWGYASFALDVYGTGVRPTSRQSSGLATCGRTGEWSPAGGARIRLERTFIFLFGFFRKSSIPTVLTIGGKCSNSLDAMENLKPFLPGLC